MIDSRGRLRSLLYEGLRGRRSPVLAGSDLDVPAASLWSGARLWVHRFRELGLAPGDRIVLALGASPGALMALIAAWWEGLTVCPRATAGDGSLAEVDGRLLLADEDLPHCLGAETAGNPREEAVVALRPAGPPTPGVALLVNPEAAGPMIALRDINVVAQIEAYTAVLGLDPTDVALNVSAWDSAWTWLVDLWPALLGGATVFIEDSEGRDPLSVFDCLAAHNITHLNMSAAQAEALFNAARSLSGELDLQAIAGVVGGAVIPDEILPALRASAFRVGYGLTACAGAATLGRPGEFFPGWIGRPLSCTTRCHAGELLISGPTVAAEYWSESSLQQLPTLEGDELHTGDRVQPSVDGFLWLGRTTDALMLSDGTQLDAPLFEHRLRPCCRGGRPVLVTPDGVRISLAVVGGIGPLDRALVAQVLGIHAGRLADVVRLDPSHPILMTKGQPDRVEVLARLRRCADQAA